jgi:hypothetical protein
MILSVSTKKELMKSKSTAGILFLLVLIFSCDEEPIITSSIEGTWRGTRAEIRINPYGLPIPIKGEDESFGRIIAFNADGTMVVQGNGQPTEGTYRVESDKLITDIALTVEDITLSGTYTIETLTDKTLVFFKKQKNVFVNPEKGPNVSGKVKVTLHFERIN